MQTTKHEKLWKSQQILLEILQQRGYGETEQFIQTYDEFCGKFPINSYDEGELKDSLQMIFEQAYVETAEDNPGPSTRITMDRIIILYSKDEKLGKNIQNIKNTLDENECENAIIVVDKEVTSNSQKIILESRRKNKIYMTVYALDELQFNISKHVLFPSHTICSKKEKREIFTKYGINKKDGICKVPQIKYNDPAVRHVGAKIGNLIRIIRNSTTLKGEKSISYRLVV